MRNQEGKIELQKKKYVEEIVCGTSFFDCTPSFLCNLLLLSLSSPSPFPSDVLVEWPLYKDT